MKVQDIMVRNIRVAHPDTSLLEISSVMCLYRIPGLPVVDGGKLVGFVAEKDVLARLFPSLADLMEGMATVDFEGMEKQYGDVMNLKVRDIMTHQVISVRPDMSILQAAAIMARYKFRRIPVTSAGDKLEGMVSLGDVHKALFHANVSRMGQ